MLVDRIGYTPVKGTRHRAHESATLGPGGVEGDRVLCLVDPDRDQVLRTVENGAGVQVLSHLHEDQLRLDLPGGSVGGTLEPTGRVHPVAYWGRRVEVEDLDGPLAAALENHLGRRVVLARAVEPGGVVYAGSVTLVTTSSVDELAGRVGTTLDSARFRSTLVIDTPGEPAHVEDTWVGRQLQVGDAVLQVTAVLPRCAVVDVDPVSGERDVPVLAYLGRYRRSGSEIVFGVDAEVVRPGRVALGDPVRRERS